MFPVTAILDVGMRLVDKFFPNPEDKAKAQLELLQMQQAGDFKKIEADIAEQQELTKRHEADMASDSWLSKNIRPLSLIGLFTAYLVFAFMSAFDMDTNESYTILLGQWGQLAFGFYFGSRGLEKIAEIRANGKK
jgi:hypothetical protein